MVLVGEILRYLIAHPQLNKLASQPVSLSASQPASRKKKVTWDKSVRQGKASNYQTVSPTGVARGSPRPASSSTRETTASPSPSQTPSPSTSHGQHQPNTLK